MQSRFLKTPEGFPYRQIPNDVECNEVEPRNDILRPILGILVQARDKQIDVFFDQWFLFSESLIGECVAQESSVAAVVGIIFHSYDTNQVQWVLSGNCE